MLCRRIDVNLVYVQRYRYCLSLFCTIDPRNSLQGVGWNRKEFMDLDSCENSTTQYPTEKYRADTHWEDFVNNQEDHVSCRKKSRKIDPRAVDESSSFERIQEIGFVKS